MAAAVTYVCLVAYFVLLAVVVVDRARLKQRLNNAQGSITGLRLDVEAMRERIGELQEYLGKHDSWEVGVVGPAPLSDPTPPGRWSPSTTTSGALEPGRSDFTESASDYAADRQE